MDHSRICTNNNKKCSTIPQYQSSPLRPRLTEHSFKTEDLYTGAFPRETQNQKSRYFTSIIILTKYQTTLPICSVIYIYIFQDTCQESSHIQEFTIDRYDHDNKNGNRLYCIKTKNVWRGSEIETIDEFIHVSESLKNDH